MMGTWFVIGVKPTPFETKNSNAVERYTWLNNDKKGGNDFSIDFAYNADEPVTSKLKSVPQKGWIDDEKSAVDPQNRQLTKTGNWKVSPMWPLKLPYLLLEVDLDNYTYCVVGYPSRAYCWIMARTPKMDDQLYDSLTEKLKVKHQYDLTGLRKVPQKWTKEERAKRNLIAEIPDTMLD
jgi:apolipoprotein D and lipocalin family protein